MPNKILIIGVGSAGINAVDKMDLPNSKKLFLGSNYRALREVKSEGDKIGIACKARSGCPSLYCHCFQNPDFCKTVVRDYEDEIRESIRKAFE